MRSADTELASGEKAEITNPVAQAEQNLKVEINTLIWMHAPPTVTLGEAETLACKIMDGIYKGKL